MRIVKYVLYALGAIALVLGVLLAYIAATFDPNAYKPELQRLVRESTQRTLTINGDLRLTFFPKIGVSLGPTRLSERGGDAEFAAVNDVRVALALLPLLSKRVVVDEVVIDGLRAHLIRNSDGTTNIDDLIGAGTASPTAGTSSQPESSSTESTQLPVVLDIAGVRFTDGELAYADEQSGSRYTVSGLTLKTGRFAASVPMRFDLAADVRGNPPALAVHVTAGGTVEADPDRRKFHFGGLGVEAGGVAGAEPFHVKLDIPTLALDQGALAVDKLAATASGNFAGVQLSTARLIAPKLDVDLAHQRVDVGGLSVTASGRREANGFELTLDAPALSVTPERAGGGAVRATLKAHGPQLDVNAVLALSALEGTAEAIRVAEIGLDIEATTGDSHVKGKIASPLTADLDKRTLQLPALAGHFDLQSPTLPAKRATLAVNGSAGADVSREAAHADLAAKFDESSIQAKAEVNGFAKPAVRLDVAIDRLNVDRYRPARTGPAATAAAAPVPAQEETPLDLSALKTLKLDGSIRIGELVASNVKASNVRVAMKVADGRLTVDPLQASLYQGSLKGSALVDANHNRYVLKQALTGVSIGPLLRDALAKDLLEGQGNVDLDLSATGDTVSALKRTLTGAARLVLRDGAVKGINLAQSLRNARNFLSLGKDSESAASTGEKTDFSELTASFAIKDGKAHNEDLAMKSPFLRLSGAGDVDLVQGTLDYQAKVSVVASTGGQGGKDAADLAGLTVPLRVSGPYSALRYKIEFGSASGLALKQQLQEKKQELKQKLEGEISDKLLGGQQSQSEGEQPAQPPVKPEQVLKNRLKDFLK